MYLCRLIHGFTMKKYCLDLQVVENRSLSDDYFLLKLTSYSQLPEMRPGQFVGIRVDHSPATFLRRPISIHFVDWKKNELWLLIQCVGEGTLRMLSYEEGDTVNLLMPLGNGFTIPPFKYNVRALLVGGGVGIAPLLYLGKELYDAGFITDFLLGFRRKDDMVQYADYRHIGHVYITTDDGSWGQKGFVTDHTLLQEETYDYIFTCGPKPMMVEVAKYAVSKGIPCEVSLENTMACGFGACLCCVEKTIEGHKCVCTEGPVFNINQLTWLS